MKKETSIEILKSALMLVELKLENNDAAFIEMELRRIENAAKRLREYSREAQLTAKVSA